MRRARSPGSGSDLVDQDDDDAPFHDVRHGHSPGTDLFGQDDEPAPLGGLQPAAALGLPAGAPGGEPGAEPFEMEDQSDSLSNADDFGDADMHDEFKTDVLGNRYIERSSACVHFSRFVSFSGEQLSHQRWLERCEVAAMETAPAAPGGRGRCFKCGGGGHWARDCTASASDQESGAEQPLDKASPIAQAADALTATVQKKATKAAAVRKPRVLLKKPPCWQRSAKAAFSSA